MEKEKQGVYSALILDDERPILNSLMGALKRRGFITWGTENPEDAIRFVETHRPSVACVDLHMPKVNGIEVIKRMRQIIPDIRVIAVTAYLSTYQADIEELKVRVVVKGSQTNRELEAVICEELALSQQEFAAIKTRKKTKLKLRVLFVDDEWEAADFNKEIVITEGMEAESAHSPAEALEKAKSFQPNVVCTDLKMQNMNGDELIKRMKDSGEYPFVKLYVALTGFSHEKEGLFEAGAAEVLTKPCGMSEFMEALGRWAALVEKA